MNIMSRLLSSGDVIVGLDVPNKLRALEQAAVILERRHKVSHAPVLRALWRREQVGSTALGHGIAVPHAISLFGTDWKPPRNRLRSNLYSANGRAMMSNTRPNSLA